MIKYLSAFLVLLLAGLAYHQGWLPFLHSGKDRRNPLPSVKAVRADIAPMLPLSGEVTPAFQVDVKPETGGKIEAIHVVAGQQVSKGDLLVTIDDSDLLNERAGTDAEIEGARLSVGKTQGNYERAKQLYDRKLLSKEDYVNLEADYKIAENELERSLRRRQLVDDRISKTRILSPADGTILDVLVNEGQVVVAAASVNSGTSLIIFADLSRLLINTHVNQLDAGKLEVGRTMLVNPPQASEKPVNARISFIAPLATVKNNIKGFEVAGEIDGNQHTLKPGVSVSMNVPLGKVENVVAVPITAVFDDDGTKVAYVAGEGKPERREVVVGLGDSALVEIRSGIAEGETVFTVEPAESGPEKSSKL